MSSHSMSNRLSYSALLLCSIFVLQSILTGCGYISLARKTEFVPITEDVTVSIAPAENGPYTVVSSKNSKIKLNHFKKNYWVKQEKSGHVSKTQELTRTGVNKLRRLDLALLIPASIMVSIFTPMHFLAGGTYGVSQNKPSTIQSVALFTTIGATAAGWIAFIPCPGHIYPKKVELPALIPILTKDEDQLFLTAGKHEFKLKKRGVRVRDYPTMKQFNSGYGYETRDTTESFKFLEKLKLYDEVSTLLKAADYGIDSAKAELNNTLRVDSWTRSAIFLITESQLRCELRTTWALETMDQLQYLYDRSKTSHSEWIPFAEDSLSNEQQEAIIKQAFNEAADQSLKKFLAMDTIQTILSNPVPIPLQEEEEMELHTGSTFCASVSDAVKSVITVVTNTGHGSGCIVTPEGYIITNAHVVEDDTSGLKAIMSNQPDKRIPLRFIRMNKAVDLALLKLDTTEMVPLKLCVKNQIETGADAYAIGTPADLDLGQTVTRGIISGKRKFGGRQLIQTDVAISPGNSGGALIRSDGLLCGIVTSALDGKEINDIGFAIPAPLIESALKITLSE